MLKIKTGDTVQLIAGKDYGKSGKVVFIDKKTNRVTVEGLNLITRHKKAKKQGEKGQKIQVPNSIAMSNVMIVCSHCGKLTRSGQSIDEKGIKNRMCKKCKKTI